MDLTDYVMNVMKELSVSSSSSSLSMATKLSSVTSASSLSSFFFSHNNSNSNNSSSSKHPLHDHHTTNNRSSLKYKYQPSNIDSIERMSYSNGFIDEMRTIPDTHRSKEAIHINVHDGTVLVVNIRWLILIL